MKRYLELCALFLVLISQPAISNTWQYTFNTSSCNVMGATGCSGTNTVSLNTSDGKTSFSGLLTRPSTGFFYLTLTGEGGTNPATSRLGTTPTVGSPLTIGGVYIPHVGYVFDYMLQADRQPNIWVDSPVCPLASGFVANFLFAQWNSGTSNNTTTTNQAVAGAMSWAANGAITITNVYNGLWGITSAPVPFSLGTASCSSNTETLTGSGDDGGSVWTTNSGALLFGSNAGHTIFAVPAVTLPSNVLQSMNQSYIGFRYDQSGASSLYDVEGSFNSASDTLTLTQINPNTGVSGGFTETVHFGAACTGFTCSATPNTPNTGFMEAEVQNGSDYGRLTCSIVSGMLDLTDGLSQDSIICSGQSPNGLGTAAASDGTPYNLVLVAKKDSAGWVDHSYASGSGNVTTIVDGIAAGTTAEAVNAMALTTDGKAVVVGQAGSPVKFAIGRFNSDGTLDTTFGGTNTKGTNSTQVSLYGSPTSKALAVALDTAGHIYVSGQATATLQSTGTNIMVLSRYTAAGILDTTFDSGGLAISGTSAVGAGTTAPINAGGTYSYGTKSTNVSYGYGVGFQSTGKILVGGYAYITAATKDDLAVARFLTTGAFDTTYGTAGKAIFSVPSSTNDIGLAMAVDSSDRAVVVGESQITTVKLTVARFLSTGAIDSSFGTSGGGYSNVQVYSGSTSKATAVTFQTDGKIVVGGYAVNPTRGGGGGYDWLVARYLTTGVIDTTFNTAGYNVWGSTNGQAVAAGTNAGNCTAYNSTNNVSDYGNSVALQKDGKILLAVSEENDTSSIASGCIVRLNTDGTLDTTFGNTGISAGGYGWESGIKSGTNAQNNLTAIGIQSDGNMVVGGFTEASFLGGDAPSGASEILSLWRFFK